MKRTGGVVDLNQELALLVDQTLNLGGRAAAFSEATPMLGAVPELDSMGVVSLITALEERFDISINDDEIDGAVFETFGTLLAFVAGKLAQ
jgi:acyl carrier protein